jgi:nucleolin
MNEKNINKIQHTNRNNEECKIFVGNVPYQCSQEEFEKCFESVDGFIKAEIITVYKSNTSRGFGFITLRSLYDAEKLKYRDDILFKGRMLRFTSYQTYNSQLTMDNLNNYIFVDGIPSGKNREWLKKSFSEYEPIGRCFVAMHHETGKSKNNGLIEILDDLKYKAILSKGWHEFDGVILEASKYKIKIKN